MGINTKLIENMLQAMNHCAGCLEHIIDSELNLHEDARTDFHLMMGYLEKAEIELKRLRDEEKIGNE